MFAPASETFRRVFKTYNMNLKLLLYSEQKEGLMGKLLVFSAPHEIAYQNYEDAPLKADEVRIKTL